MPVYQTNIFICEVCFKIESQTKEEEMHSDPVIHIDGWEYPHSKPNTLHCPSCYKKLLDSEDAVC